MFPNLNPNPITPDEAFAAAREALDAYEALIPRLAGNRNIDPVIPESSRLIIELLRAQLFAAEAVVIIGTDPEAMFNAGYTAGSIVQLVTASTGVLTGIVNR